MQTEEEMMAEDWQGGREAIQEGARVVAEKAVEAMDSVKGMSEVVVMDLVEEAMVVEETVLVTRGREVMRVED